MSQEAVAAQAEAAAKTQSVKLRERDLKENKILYNEAYRWLLRTERNLNYE